MSAASGQPVAEANIRSDVVRFSDVTLGQPIILDQREDTLAAVGERMCDVVSQWSGSPTASLVSIQTPAEHLVPDSLDGRVLARHLDGSNQADDEIFLRSQEKICLSAVVRVALG